jgi:hypothetical protein
MHWKRERDMGEKRFQISNANEASASRRIKEEYTANNFKFMYSQIYNWPNLTPKYQLNISKQNYNTLSGIMLFFREVESLGDYNASFCRVTISI